MLGSYLLPLLIPYGFKKTCTKGCPAQEQDFLNVELTVCLFFAEVFELLLVRFLHCVFCFLFTLIKLIYWLESASECLSSFPLSILSKTSTSKYNIIYFVKATVVSTFSLQPSIVKGLSGGLYTVAETSTWLQSVNNNNCHVAVKISTKITYTVILWNKKMVIGSHSLLGGGGGGFTIQRVHTHGMPGKGFCKVVKGTICGILWCLLGLW